MVQVAACRTHAEPMQGLRCRQMQVSTREQLLAGIIYFRARDYLEQVLPDHVHQAEGVAPRAQAMGSCAGCNA